MITRLKISGFKNMLSLDVRLGPFNCIIGFLPQAAVHRNAELIADFSPLRELPAFARLEEALAAVLAERGWTPDHR